MALFKRQVKSLIPKPDIRNKAAQGLDPYKKPQEFHTTEKGDVIELGRVRTNKDKNKV